MTIEARALLAAPDIAPSNPNARIDPLEDCVLLDTGAPFDSEPEALSERVRALVGAALARHQDPRGIFFIPSVAPIRARRYAELIAEVGEGGMWGPLPGAAGAPSEQGLGALLAGMMGQLPEGLLEAASQMAASVDPRALESQLESMVAQDPGLAQLAAQLRGGRPDLGAPEALPAQLAQALAAFGVDASQIDLSSPELQQLVSRVQGELAANPALLSELTAQLFGKK